MISIVFSLILGEAQCRALFSGDCFHERLGLTLLVSSSLTQLHVVQWWRRGPVKVRIDRCLYHKEALSNQERTKEQGKQKTKRLPFRIQISQMTIFLLPSFSPILDPFLILLSVISLPLRWSDTLPNSHASFLGQKICHSQRTQKEIWSQHPG
jgi:hypothetical protein